MALFKHTGFFRRSYDAGFDRLHRPGMTTPFSGIYQCQNCRREVASNAGNPLPPQNHHQHNPPRPIVWRLIAAAQT